MNILFLADNFPPEKNAQASRVYERACYWLQWGHQVTVITCAPNFPEGKVYPGYRNSWYCIENMSGIRVVRVKTFVAPNAGRWLRIIDFLSYMIAAFFAGLPQRRPDVVVATSPQFFAAVAGCGLARAKRVPFVLELSDLWPESIVAVGAMKRSAALRAVAAIEMYLYRHSSAIVALTQSFENNLVRRGVPSSKIAVVRNGVNLETFWPRPKDRALASRWGIGPDDFVVSYIGTLGMAHGLENVLKCAAILNQAEVRFLFVGSGAEREKLIGEAGRRGLRNVIFVPPQPKHLMPSFWSISDVALVHLRDAPLFGTVIPSKIFEAMGMGVPILLAAPKGEASRIVLDENVGMWIPPGDPEALADAVRRLAADPTLREGFANGSRMAARRHSRERQAGEMMACLNGVVGLADAARSLHALPHRSNHDSAYAKD